MVMCPLSHLCVTKWVCWCRRKSTRELNGKNFTLFSLCSFQCSILCDIKPQAFVLVLTEYELHSEKQNTSDGIWQHYLSLCMWFQIKDIWHHAVKSPSLFPLLRAKVQSVCWSPYRGQCRALQGLGAGAGAGATLCVCCTQERGGVREPGIPHMQGKVLAFCVKPGCEFSADLLLLIWSHLYQVAEAIPRILPKPLEEIEVAVCVSTVQCEALSFPDVQESWALLHLWPCSGEWRGFHA